MSDFKSKKHRLPLAAYQGEKNVSFTANIENHYPLFRDAEVVSQMLPILKEETERYACFVGIYCFMPDHLHMIVCGMSENADAKTAFDKFKQRTGLWLSDNGRDARWQDGYYDHIIRKSDDWRSQLRYVYLNPVRKGLINDPSDWPYTGAIGFDLQELLMDSYY